MTEERVPTVYARLMDASLEQPSHDLRVHIESFIRGSGLDALSSRVEKMLKEAYVAGVQDGFRDAVMKEDTP